MTPCSLCLATAPSACARFAYAPTTTQPEALFFLIARAYPNPPSPPQDKLASLIHSSEKHLDLDSCRVTVFFQDIVDKEGDEYEFVPGTELEVTRQAFRAGTSSYYVNGKKMSFKEVGQILRTRGIDLDHNRFLILQVESGRRVNFGPCTCSTQQLSRNRARSNRLP